MRTPLSILFFLLWLLLAYFYWNSYNECCLDEKISLTPEVLPAAEPPIDEAKPSFSLAFNSDSQDPLLGDKWEQLKLALMDSLNDEVKLEIKGLYQPNEINNSEYENLGIARANEIRRLIPEIPDDQILLTSSQIQNDSMGSPFNAFEFSYKMNTEEIKEIEDKTRIYFGFQSAKNIINKSIENYLDDVAERVIKSGETVQLIGHTDNISSKASNMRLGLKRARTIATYLMNKGVPEEQIVIQSKGEDEPVATNDTPEGRAENRRTELQIIK